ncbi:MAG: hypothetical protein ACTSYR_01915 [Candidatus Odinarchaeia archaeon]
MLKETKFYIRINKKDRDIRELKNIDEIFNDTNINVTNLEDSIEINYIFKDELSKGLETIDKLIVKLRENMENNLQKIKTDDSDKVK